MTETTDPSAPTAGAAAAASRDSHLTLRRVERQQHLIETLYASRWPLTRAELAADLGVTERTVARDLRRLRESGVPITVTAGRGGGATIERSSSTVTIVFDLPELAVLMASLAALGPTVSPSATTAMHKLGAAVRHGDNDETVR